MLMELLYGRNTCCRGKGLPVDAKARAAFSRREIAGARIGIVVGIEYDLTPHAADGRCRHAACGARGAPARRGGGRGRS